MKGLEGVTKLKMVEDMVGARRKGSKNQVKVVTSFMDGP